MIHKLLLICTLLIPLGSSAETFNDKVATTLAFISQCSGSRVTVPVMSSTAYANCTGFVQGFITGHTLTTRLGRALSKEHPATFALNDLWCVPPTTTSQQIMLKVTNWVENNEAKTKLALDTHLGIDGALFVITWAVSDAYPCVPVHKK